MKAKTFQDDIPSIPIDKFKDHYVLVFDLTSMQDATKQCHQPGLVGQTLKLELIFTFPLEDVTDIIVLGERICLVAVDKFGAFEKKSKWIKLFFSIKSTVSCYSSIGTFVHFLLTLFQFLIMTLLPL